MSPPTRDLFAAFCRAFLADLADDGTPPEPAQLQLMLPPPAVEPQPEPATKRRQALPRTPTLRPSRVRADGRTAYKYMSNEYIAIARIGESAAEYDDAPPCVWLTESEHANVSAIATYRGQTAGRSKSRRPPTGAK